MDSDTLCAQLMHEHLLGEQREQREQILGPTPSLQPGAWRMPAPLTESEQWVGEGHWSQSDPHPGGHLTAIRQGLQGQRTWMWADTGFGSPGFTPLLGSSTPWNIDSTGSWARLFDRGACSPLPTDRHAARARLRRRPHLAWESQAE